MPRTTRTVYRAPGKHIAQFRNRPLEIIIELDGDTITFRHKGHKQRFFLGVDEAMREAITRTATRKL